MNRRAKVPEQQWWDFPPFYLQWPQRLVLPFHHWLVEQCSCTAVVELKNLGSTLQAIAEEIT